MGNREDDLSRLEAYIIAVGFPEDVQVVPLQPNSSQLIAGVSGNSFLEIDGGLNYAGPEVQLPKSYLREADNGTSLNTATDGLPPQSSISEEKIVQQIIKCGEDAGCRQFIFEVFGVAALANLGINSAEEFDQFVLQIQQQTNLTVDQNCVSQPTTNSCGCLQGDRTRDISNSNDPVQMRRDDLEDVTAEFLKELGFEVLQNIQDRAILRQNGYNGNGFPDYILNTPDGPRVFDEYAPLPNTPPANVAKAAREKATGNQSVDRVIIDITDWGGRSIQDLKNALNQLKPKDFKKFLKGVKELIVVKHDPNVDPRNPDVSNSEIETIYTDC